MAFSKGADHPGRTDRWRSGTGGGPHEFGLDGVEQQTIRRMFFFGEFGLSVSTASGPNGLLSRRGFDQRPFRDAGFGLPKIAELLPTQKRLDQRRQRVRNHHRDHPVSGTPNQLAQTLGDPFFGRRNGFALWRAKIIGRILTTTINARLIPLDFLDQLSVPQSVVDVLKAFDDFDPRPASFGDSFGGL